MSREDKLAEIDAAIELIEDGDPESALEALEGVDPRLGERYVAEAIAWLELGEYARSESALARARKRLAERDPWLLCTTGDLALAQWRAEEARKHFEGLGLDDRGADWHERMALACDVRGDFGSSDRHHERSAELDPQAYPRPPRLATAAFESIVREAAEALPDEFRQAFEELAVVIDPMPTAAIVGAPASGHPPDVLGLYVGPPLGERGSAAPSEMPPTIFLFQRNLERIARDHDTLVEEIRTTLYHELGHALGFDEEGVDEMGLG